MKFAIQTVLICALAIAGTSKAQDRAIACLTTDVPSEKSICAWESYRDQAVQLIHRVNRAILIMDAEDSGRSDETTSARALLIQSQEAWEAYREATCALETHLFVGGDAASLAYSTCLQRLTENRNKDLRVLLQED